MKKHERIGLDLTNIGFLSVILFVVMVFVTPSGSIFLRMLYMLGVPLAFFLIIFALSRRWKLDDQDNDRINRWIVAMIAGALYVSVFIMLNEKSHIECSSTVRSYDGYECVGDYKRAIGPNYGGAVMAFIFGSFASWYAIAKRDD